MKYSVVIPVFNSQDIVSETVSRVENFFTEQKLAFEIILVNDGSSDDSWSTIKALATSNANVIAINLLRNYGQHSANLCGFKYSTGDWIVTIDDDLQNPPEEIGKLIKQSMNGAPLIIGKFKQKKHASYRKIGSYLIQKINKRIFKTPDGIVLTNFRLIHRTIIDKICEYRTSYPYVTGLSVLFAHTIENVEVEHHPRGVSKSNYDFLRIAKLVSAILFNYSSYPLRIVSLSGGIFAIFSFTLGAIYLFRSLVFGSTTPGWPTLVVLLSVFSAIIMSMLSMIGEYLVRLVNQTSYSESYVVREIIESDAH
ncbi:MAG: glycosyltransferase family 2 protein [Phycisphaerales bacterium]|nr:glycosyltransferase family 2 protein [Phycisphaerales bacterium]